MRRSLASRPTAVFARIEGVAGEKAGARILIVEDDDAARSALERLLRAEGFVTSSAADGEAALAEASRMLPDVVLTDLHMPGMDGLELCRRLRAMARGLPVIVMTAQADVESVIDSLRERAADYLLKPLQPEMVFWCIERAITRRDAKREMEETQRALNERLVVSSIREQEHAEAEAQRSARVKALLENLSEGVIIADTRSRALTVNEAARVILGLPAMDQGTVAALDALAVHDLQGLPLPREQRPLTRALRGEQFMDYEVIRTRPNGERRRVVSTGTCVRDEHGKVLLAIVVFRDVTELRRLEQQREEYLSLISHDLRNPLSVDHDVSRHDEEVHDRRAETSAISRGASEYHRARRTERQANERDARRASRDDESRGARGRAAPRTL